MNLPKWKCHKEVQAAKIVAIWPGRKLGAGPGSTLEFEDGSWVSVGEDYMSKHKPEEGGYYVAYEDGYSSFSPAAAFEAGYTMIGPPVPRCAICQAPASCEEEEVPAAFICRDCRKKL